MSFLFHEAIHFTLFLIASIFFYMKYKSWLSILLLFASGILIDADHIFDYLLYTGLTWHNWEFLTTGKYFDLAGTIYVLFHAWEYVILFLILGKLTGKQYIFYALAVGMALHLIWDQVTYSPNLLYYSIIYRVVNNFAFQKFW